MFCEEAMSLERKFQKSVATIKAFGKVIQGEESLLKLASYTHLSTGIFYAMPFHIEFGGVNHVYVR